MLMCTSDEHPGLSCFDSSEEYLRISQTVQGEQNQKPKLWAPLQQENLGECQIKLRTLLQLPVFLQKTTHHLSHLHKIYNLQS